MGISINKITQAGRLMRHATRLTRKAAASPYTKRAKAMGRLARMKFKGLKPGGGGVTRRSKNPSLPRVMTKPRRQARRIIRTARVAAGAAVVGAGLYAAHRVRRASRQRIQSQRNHGLARRGGLHKFGKTAAKAGVAVGLGYGAARLHRSGGLKAVKKYAGGITGTVKNAARKFFRRGKRQIR